MKKIRQYSKNFPDLFTIADHEEGAPEAIAKLVKEFNPELILELGTWMGAITLVLHEACPNVQLYSFDWGNIERYQQKYEEFITMDELLAFKSGVFNQNVFLVHAHLIRNDYAFEFLTQLCKLKKKKFLYCDNGAKHREMTVYGNHLNIGDMMGCHDWGTRINRETSEITAFDDYMPFNEIAIENRWTSRFFTKVRESPPGDPKSPGYGPQ